MTTLLAIQSVTVTRGRRVLITDLSLRVDAGCAMELRGANGSGKSTLLRCIAGLYPDSRGRIDAPDAAYVGHADGLSGLLTVEENLRWYGCLAGHEADASRIAEALARLQVEALARRPCRALSAGQRRRVALARLLLLERRLWLLDEPLTALDAQGTRLVGALIEEHCGRGGAVLAATHADMPGTQAQTWIGAG